MTSGAAVEVEGLTRRFGERRAVDDLTFRVDGGELFGLVGPDGAGKTTTLRMLSGVLPPTSGDARIGGDSVARRPEAVKPRIAYMPQRFGLYSDLTVAENLRFYADLFEVPAAERRRTLDRLYEFSRLGPFRRRLAGDLSGGMRQKLGLSCALVHQPELLLLDEPTFGVDPVSRRELWLIVHEMVGRGMTALISTSYLDEAERFDRVALLAAGRLGAVDTPDALREPLRGRLFEVRAADLRAARRAAAGLEGVLRAELFGEKLHLSVRGQDRRAEELQRALAEAGVEAPRVRPIPPSLEDVFVERTADGGGEREPVAAGEAS